MDGRGLFLSGVERDSIQQIAYISYPGGAVRHITSDLNGYGVLSLPSDSRSLAAIRLQRRYNIWAASLSEPEKALPITSGELSGDPNWMPDGRLIYTNNSQIWVMNPDGSGARQLTTKAGAENYSARVPRDGHYVFFRSSGNGADAI